MNRELDLDTLRGRWNALDRHLDASLELDVASLRRALSEHMHSAFRRHSRWLLAALAFDVCTLLAIIVFGAANRHDWPYVLCAAALLLPMLLQTATDLNQWRVLRQLDLDAPVLDVRVRIDALRSRRLRTIGMILLLSLLLWTPLVFVLSKGLFGFDLYRVLHWSVLAVNLALGVAFIPLGAWIGRHIARRFRGSAGYEQFLDDAAGKSWSEASTRWDAYSSLNKEIDRDDAAQVLASHAQQLAQARAIAPQLRALKRSQGFGIALAIVPMLLLAAFNARHGGMPYFIVSGVLLHLVFVAKMVACIAHLSALSRLDLAAAPERVAASLDWMAAQHARLVRAIIVMMPVLALAAAIVLAKALTNLDLPAIVPATWQIATAAFALAATLWLARSSRRQADRFAPRIVEALCLGTRQRTRAVITALLSPSRRDSG
jgi:hypothetical protein